MEEDILERVGSNWSDVPFQGRLSGYRYCFTRSLPDQVLPLYLHLVVQNHRRKRQLVAFWNVSLFPQFRWKNVPRELSVSTDPVTTPSKNPKWANLARELSRLRPSGEGEIVQSFLEDKESQEILWRLYQKEDVSSAHAVFREIVSRPGFTMSEPGYLKLGQFLEGYKPADSPTEEGVFSLESSRARRKLADFQLRNPHDFVVHLISGAIAGGAEKVKVYVDSGDIVEGVSG